MARRIGADRGGITPEENAYRARQLQQYHGVITNPLDLPRVSQLVGAREFLLSPCFTPEFVAKLIYHGCFPMATTLSPNLYVLLVKLHVERCVILWKDLHIQTNALKKSKNYTMTMNRDFNAVVKHCSDQHSDCWLYPPLVEVFRSLQQTPVDGITVHSIELWEGDELVAGELGFQVGAVYASLTGFKLKSGAGTVQLCATGKFLQSKGIRFWDLGMSMDYKIKLGGRKLPRALFLRLLSESRDISCPLSLPDPVNAKALITGGPVDTEVKRNTDVALGSAN